MCFNLKFSSGNCTQIVSLPPIASQVIQITAYLATIDGLAAGTVALGKVTALNPKSPLPINDPFSHSKMSQKMDLHKVLDNSVERRALIAVAKVLAIRVLTSSKRAEVLDSLGHGPTRKKNIMIKTWSAERNQKRKGAWRTYLP